MNFEDRSVGIYWTSELYKELVDEIVENSKNKLIYWDKETLVMKDSCYRVTIKLIKLGDESKWIVAGIK
ncbi:hypothetical protein BAOM_2955 [Peribacillus asahii]|uniref:Uncharacterized protein n=1 Tax=Peribacillus asahii TaxID=228899 RepID=A0A3Q9RNE7_9BACI|nr:hypothetical protein BAOM_2955 [Peribacillus asahii]